MAKEILLADSIEPVAEVMRQNPGNHGELRLENVDPAVAAAEIHAALDLTEMTMDPPVSEDYAGGPAQQFLTAAQALPYALPYIRCVRQAST
jgi:hypothetical protein